MFVGKHEVRLDSKNRVIVPQRLRESGREGGQLCAEFYLTLGDEGCVAVYMPDAWNDVMGGIGATRPVPDAAMRMVQRLVAANAVRLECDGAGRIVLPAELRAYAGLKRDVLWIGCVNRAEIWDKDRWLEYQAKHVSQLGEKLDVVAQAGIMLPKGTEPARKGPDVGRS